LEGGRKRKKEREREREREKICGRLEMKKNLTGRKEV